MAEGSGNSPGGEPQTPPGRSASANIDDGSMAVLVSGILLLGGIGLFIGWGLSHAYPGS